jgi:hypothetical protein
MFGAGFKAVSKTDKVPSLLSFQPYHRNRYQIMDKCYKGKEQNYHETIYQEAVFIC